MVILNSIRQNWQQPNGQNILKNGLNVLFNCLTFPFAFSYYNFSNMVEQDEISTSLYPEEWAASLGDQSLYEGIFSVIETKQFSKNVIHSAVKVISRIASTRSTLFQDENIQRMFKCQLVKGLSLCLANLDLSDTDYLQELIDYSLRLQTVYGNRKISLENDTFSEWVNCCTILARQTITNCYKLDDITFPRFCELWKRLNRQKVDNIDLSETIAEFVKIYCVTYFDGSVQVGNFFEDVSYKSYKKFKKAVNNRFDMMNEFYTTKSEEILQLILTSSLNLFSDFQYILENHINNQIYDDKILMFITRFSHFLLFSSQTLNNSAHARIYYYPPNDDVTENTCIIQGNIWARVFMILKGLSQFHPFLNMETIRHSEMCVQYFQEWFSELSIDDLVFPTDKSPIETGNKIFNNTCANVEGLFTGVESYHLLLTNKILANFSFKDKIIGRYSIMIQKNFIEKFKRRLPRKSFKEMDLQHQWSTELLRINDSALSEPKFYKLRSDLYEVVSRCYLDDCYDEYIQNSHKIFNMVLETNMNTGGNMQVNLMRFFRDLLGVCRSISQTKIFYTFSKIIYPTVQNLLNEHGNTYLNEESFIIVQLDFYSVLCRNTSVKIYGQSNIIIYKILTDACKMLTSLIGQFNKALQDCQTQEALITFVGQKNKIAFRFQQVFNNIMQSSDLNYSIFHFFGDNTFIDFIKCILEYLFLLEPSIDVIFLVDKQKLEFPK